MGAAPPPDKPDPTDADAGLPDGGVLVQRLVPYLRNAPLLRQALAHRSYCGEFAGQQSNERLEFLGDAVLGLVVTEHLYRTLPELPEGDLARIRSAVVSTEALAPVASALGVGAALLLGRGEDNSGGRDKPSLLADALEALIGATYLAGGLEPARELVLDLLIEEVEAASLQSELGDAKNRLQEFAARLALEAPRYALREDGPDHSKRFSAEVRLGARLVGSGRGRSKKQAERAAAEAALAVLKVDAGSSAAADHPRSGEGSVPPQTGA